MTEYSPTSESFAIYARVSTVSQLDNGSIEEQVAQAERLCTERGWHIHDRYIDPGISGALFDGRGELQRLLHDAEAGCFKFVLIKNIKRLARTEEIFARIIKILEFDLGVQVVATDSPQIVDPALFNPRDRSRRLMQGMEALIAQDDYLYTIENLAAGKKRAFQRGRKSTGTVPYGYSRQYDLATGESILVPNPAQYPALSYMRDMVLKGYSINKLAVALDKTAWKPLQAARWSNAVLSYILRNPYYGGKVALGRRKVIKGKRTRNEDFTTWAMTDHACHRDCAHPWSWQEFLLIQEKLKQFKGFQGRTSSSPHPLTGLLRCGQCGYMLASTSGYGGAKYYRCDRRFRTPPDACPGVMLKIDTAVQIVLSHVAEMATQFNSAPETFFQRFAQPETTGLTERLNILRQEEKRLDRRGQNLEDDYLDEKINIEEYRRIGSRNQARLQEIKSDIVKIEMELQMSSQVEARQAALATIFRDWGNWKNLLDNPVSKWDENSRVTATLMFRTIFSAMFLTKVGKIPVFKYRYN